MWIVWLLYVKTVLYLVKIHFSCSINHILSIKKGIQSTIYLQQELLEMLQCHGGHYFASAVGEVNVGNMMKEKMQLLAGKEMVGIYLSGTL